MNKFTKIDDILHCANGNIANPIFTDIDVKYARYDGVSVVDARGLSDFFIDDIGVKHISQHKPGWQSLSCEFSDVLINDGGVWRGRNLSDEVDEAKVHKKQEVDDHAYALTDNAFSEPVQGLTTDPGHQLKKMSLRRNSKVDKLAGGIVLTQAEKDEAKKDQKLSEYEYKVIIDSDKAKTNIDKLNTVTEVNDFDVSAETWTVWAAPV